jgi:chromosome partitioning protein
MASSKRKNSDKPMILSIETNAGGVSKSTIAYNVAYELGALGYRVGIIELDPNLSLALFVGLIKQGKLTREILGTVADILDSEFSGEYPWIDLWESKTKNVQICIGGDPLYGSIRQINQDPLGVMTLAKRFKQYPIDKDFIIIDCPATLEPLPLVALAASTHVLLPIHPEFKATFGTATMLAWFDKKIADLDRDPPPKIIGMVVSRIKADWEFQQKIANSIEAVAKRRKIPYFNPIPENAYIAKAAGKGLPLGLYRPNEPVRNQYLEIAKGLVKEWKAMRGEA